MDLNSHQEHGLQGFLQQVKLLVISNVIHMILYL